MQVSFFHRMSYGPVGEQHLNWPVPNELFDPEQALRARDECIEEIEMADQLGFDWVSAAEHHYSPNSLGPSIAVLGALMSQHVHRARIALLGALLPLGNPVRIAEELAMLDTFTSGRLVAALLRGAPYEYLVYNVDPAESRSRFEEAWDLIMKAWTERQPFGWEGNHYHFRNVSIWPRPIQQPLPPIFMSGSSKDSGEFAARKRAGLGLAFTNLTRGAEAARFYREKASEYGWEPARDQVLFRIPAICVADTDEEAYALMRQGTGAAGDDHQYGNRLVAGSGYYRARDKEAQSYFERAAEDRPRSIEDQVAQGTMLCGSPASVIQQIRRVRDEVGAGIVEILFSRPGGSRDAKLHSIELFAREVLPEVHSL